MSVWRAAGRIEKERKLHARDRNNATSTTTRRRRLLHVRTTGDNNNPTRRL